MLAVILLLSLALEVGLYIACGVALVGAGMLSLSAFVVIALSCALMFRLPLVLFTFAISHALATKTDSARRLSISEKARLLTTEILAHAFLFNVLQPFERWFMRDARTLHASGLGVAVIFVHGIYCNGAVWWWLQRRLRRRGFHNLYSINLEPLFAGIDDFAAQLEHALEVISADDRQKRIVLVTHSMGGLVARACLQHADAKHRVLSLVTIGAPHHGSWHAHLAMGTNGKQMRPGSPWLKAMERREGGAPPVPITSVFSWHDNFVSPQASGVLSGANNVALTGVGHLGLFFSTAVEERVASEIERVKDACHA